MNSLHVLLGLIEDNKGKILLLHRNLKVTDPNVWCLPGGVQMNTTSSKESLITKILAETGLDISRLQYAKPFILERKKENLLIMTKTYHMKLNSKIHDNKIKVNQEGHDDYRWVYPATCYKQPNLIQTLYPTLEHFYHLN